MICDYLNAVLKPLGVIDGDDKYMVHRDMIDDKANGNLFIYCLMKSTILTWLLRIEIKNLNWKRWVCPQSNQYQKFVSNKLWSFTKQKD